MKAFICLAIGSIGFAVNVASAGHPVRNWTDDEKKVLREALREWRKPGLTFVEVSDCSTAVDFTLRWEDGSFFKKWDDNHDWSTNQARVLTQDSIPPGWTADDKKNFPVNEIYFRSDLGGGWFVDPTPDNDGEYFVDGEGNLRAKNDGPGFGKTDLLTIAKHEVGHVLGLDHTTGGIMDGGLEQDIRRHPTDADRNKVTTTGDVTYKFIIPEPASLLLLLVAAGAIRPRLRTRPLMEG